MNSAELKGALEAIIYAADEPATLDQLAEATGIERNEVRVALDEIIGACGADERGIEIRRVARGYRYSTKPGHHEVVQKFIKSLRPPVRLSMPALETLAVIAYRQPITLPEIQEVRGVNASGVIRTLLERRLVATAGRKSVIGRPILYRTTREFLMRFGLEDVDDLPSLKDFEQLARAALGPEAGLELSPLPAPEGEPESLPGASEDSITASAVEPAPAAELATDSRSAPTELAAAPAVSQDDEPDSTESSESEQADADNSSGQDLPTDGGAS